MVFVSIDIYGRIVALRRGLKYIRRRAGGRPDASLPSRERGLKLRAYGPVGGAGGRSLHGSVD